MCKEQGNVFQTPEGKQSSLKGDCNRSLCVQRNEINPFIKSMWVKRELLICSVCQPNDIATWPVSLSPCRAGFIHLKNASHLFLEEVFCNIVI